MTRRSILGLVPALLQASNPELPDLQSVPPDLVIPPVAPGPAAPGKRVRLTLPDYQGTEVHHLLYLPPDWSPRKRWPVIVEYAGNGNYRNEFGDVSDGSVEGSRLGFGASGGKGFLWLCLPFVNQRDGVNQALWWGDVEATVAYCRRAVASVCREFGGDPRAVILAGFSRGAIACNYIGLHDDSIAGLWRAFIPYSHYDGVRTTWPYPAADRDSALARLQRLQGRPVFLCQEVTVEPSRSYLEATGLAGSFTFQPVGFRNHNDAWVLRDVPERRALRSWLARVLRSPR